jgi:hypothetical protein
MGAPVGGLGIGSGATGFHEGIYMEDWTSGVSPYLNSIKEALRS